MPALSQPNFSRVFGNEAVLSRLERLGRNPRILPNMVEAGFPAHQLVDASQLYAQMAGNPVEHYASQNMARGFFEDESLLRVFCRYFECTDWKLENSPWFFSQDDYERFYNALIEPVEFQTAQLEQGFDEARWGPHFARLPFDLGMERAKQALWDDICRQEYYWKPLANYAHLRAEALFGYLKRTVNLQHFTPDRYNYFWEGVFRQRLQRAMRRFEQKLEEALRLWQEIKRERKHRFRYNDYSALSAAALGSELLQAFACLGLEPGSATLAGVRHSFRRLSKQTHPDHGGAREDFQRLAHSKDLVEAWLMRHADN
ncbi:MAG TPA: hypothetical protein VKB51_03685 [bacterium]|nr:hypothetical protein [bacterium]